MSKRVEQMHSGVRHDLGLGKVVLGKKELRKLKECSYIGRVEAMADSGGKCVKTRWVPIENGSDVRRSFVAPEFGLVRRDTSVVRCAIAGPPDGELSRQEVAPQGLGHFICAPVKRTLHIDLPKQDGQSQGVTRLESWIGIAPDKGGVVGLAGGAEGYIGRDEVWASRMYPWVNSCEELEVGTVTHVDNLMETPEGQRDVDDEVRG